MVVWLLRRLRSWVRGMRPPFLKNHGVETTRYFMLEGIEEPVVCDVELRSRDAASPPWRWKRERSEELKLFQKNTVSELVEGREYALEIRYCSSSLVPNPRSLRFTIPSSQEGLAAVKEPLGIIRLEQPRTALTGAFDAIVVPDHGLLVGGVAVVVGMVFAARRTARRTGPPIKSAEPKLGGVKSQHGDDREIAATIAAESTMDNATLKGQALLEVLGSSSPPSAAARIMSPQTTTTPTPKKARQHVTPLTPPPSTQSQRQHQHQDENVTPCAKFPENESDWRRLFDSVYENNASGSCDFLDDYWGTSSSSAVALTGNNNNGHTLASPGGQPKARPVLQPYDDQDDCSSDEELETVMEGTIIKQAQ